MHLLTLTTKVFTFISNANAILKIINVDKLELEPIQYFLVNNITEDTFNNNRTFNKQ